MSASVDADLIEAGRAAVRAGQAENVSAWVNEALRRHAEHTEGLRAVAEFISTHEAEHGEITEEDMERAGRWVKDRAVRVGPMNEGQARPA